MLKLLGVTRQRNIVTDAWIGRLTLLQNVIESPVWAILRVKDVFSNLGMENRFIFSQRFDFQVQFFTVVAMFRIEL